MTMEPGVVSRMALLEVMSQRLDDLLSRIPRIVRWLEFS